jgi:ribosomal protein S18 acetylase RimI-like enzyme
MTPLRMDSESLTLVAASDDATLAEARALFREYQRALGVDLCFQGFDAELASLPGAYAPPRGRLYVGRVAGEAACCVALRPHDATVAEMKRLYVRSAYRGRGFGKRLAETVIADARAAGYAAIVLDTLPDMASAQAMYVALGFRDIAPYTYNPIAGARFMRLALDRPAPTAEPTSAPG